MTQNLFLSVQIVQSRFSIESKFFILYCNFIKHFFNFFNVLCMKHFKWMLSKGVENIGKYRKILCLLKLYIFLFFSRPADDTFQIGKNIIKFLKRYEIDLSIIALGSLDREVTNFKINFVLFLRHKIINN